MPSNVSYRQLSNVEATMLYESFISFFSLGIFVSLPEIVAPQKLNGSIIRFVCVSSSSTLVFHISASIFIRHLLAKCPQYVHFSDECQRHKNSIDSRNFVHAIVCRTSRLNTQILIQFMKSIVTGTAVGRCRAAFIWLIVYGLMHRRRNQSKAIRNISINV